MPVFLCRKAVGDRSISFVECETPIICPQLENANPVGAEQTSGVGGVMIGPCAISAKQVHSDS